MRIIRFAADSAPRVLEITHVSAFLRECAVEFGSADAALPGALRNDYATKCYFWLRAVVERNAARCPWLAAKLLACRSGAPVPAAALAPDVTRHDVNWGAEGARRDENLVVSSDGSALRLVRNVYPTVSAEGPVGVATGKHFFSVSVTRSKLDCMHVGWVDREMGSGATFVLCGQFDFGTAPLPASQRKEVPNVQPVPGNQWEHAPSVQCPCTVGCLLDLDAGAMTVFVNGEPLERQCSYKFPTDRAWYPSVGLEFEKDALFSNSA